MKYIGVAIILLPVLAFARLDVSANDEDTCKIVSIYYDETHNYVKTIGGCQILFDMCTDDFCSVKKIDPKELNFGWEKIGKK